MTHRQPRAPARIGGRPQTGGIAWPGFRADACGYGFRIGFLSPSHVVVRVGVTGPGGRSVFGRSAATPIVRNAHEG
ncbi:hypothetical protein KRMM14A1259_15950 [Krasilnikovia sp. MM14-A1259]